MKYYITDKENVAQGLIDYLNTNVIDALETKIYWVEKVDEDYQGIKYKVLNMNDVLKGHVRIIEKGDRLTDAYARYRTHPDGTQFAIPIMELRWYDVEQAVKDQALQYGGIVDGLTEDWNEL